MYSRVKTRVLKEYPTPSHLGESLSQVLSLLLFTCENLLLKYHSHNLEKNTLKTLVMVYLTNPPLESYIVFTLCKTTSRLNTMG